MRWAFDEAPSFNWTEPRANPRLSALFSGSLTKLADPPEISRDGKRYKFKINPNRLWSNGEPLRPQHFYRAFTKKRNDFEVIQRETTIEIRLSSSRPNFLAELSKYWAIPNPHPIDGTISLGPYFVAGDKEKRLVRNPHYIREGLPAEIEILTAPKSLCWDLYSQGEVSFASFAAGLPWIPQRNPPNLNQYATSAQIGILFDASLDADSRSTLLSRINEEELLRHFAVGEATPIKRSSSWLNRLTQGSSDQLPSVVIVKNLLSERHKGILEHLAAIWASDLQIATLPWTPQTRQAPSMTLILSNTPPSSELFTPLFQLTSVIAGEIPRPLQEILENGI